MIPPAIPSTQTGAMWTSLRDVYRNDKALNRLVPYMDTYYEGWKKANPEAIDDIEANITAQKQFVKKAKDLAPMYSKFGKPNNFSWNMNNTGGEIIVHSLLII